MATTSVEEQLESALRCVLELEELYGVAGGASAGAGGDERDDAAALERELLRRFPMPAASGADGAGGVRAAESGAVQLMFTNVAERRNRRAATTVGTDASRVVGESSSRAEARRKWIELDQSLARLSASSDSTPSSTAQPSVDSEEWHAVQRLLLDVGVGRPDRWVRVATAEDAKLRRQQQEQQQPQQRGEAVVTSAVVLGSAASSACRAILHSVLTAVHAD